jgi:hypothetical protein
MGADDNGYELAVCHQLGKGAKLHMNPPIHPQFWREHRARSATGPKNNVASGRTTDFVLG